MKMLRAIVVSLYLDARVALWEHLAALADRAQHHAAEHFGRAVSDRWPS